MSMIGALMLAFKVEYNLPQNPILIINTPTFWGSGLEVV